MQVSFTSFHQMTETILVHLIFQMIRGCVGYIIKKISHITLLMNIKDFLAEPSLADTKKINERKSY